MEKFKWKTSSLDYCNKCKRLTLHDFETWYDTKTKVDKVIVRCPHCDSTKEGKQ